LPGCGLFGSASRPCLQTHALPAYAFGIWVCRFLRLTFAIFRMTMQASYHTIEASALQHSLLMLHFEHKSLQLRLLQVFDYTKMHG
jgi:hypothetical protein